MIYNSSTQFSSLLLKYINASYGPSLICAVKNVRAGLLIDVHIFVWCMGPSSNANFSVEVVTDSEYLPNVEEYFLLFFY